MIWRIIGGLIALLGIALAAVGFWAGPETAMAVAAPCGIIIAMGYAVAVIGPI